MVPVAWSGMRGLLYRALANVALTHAKAHVVSTLRIAYDKKAGRRKFYR